MSLTYGIGNPLPALGNEGDEYINREDGGLWYKLRHEHSLERIPEWQRVGQVPVGIPGPKGDKGDQGGRGPAGSANSGDVVGPASATNSAIALFDTTTGKLLKDSAVLLTALATTDASSLTSGTLADARLPAAVSGQRTQSSTYSISAADGTWVTVNDGADVEITLPSAGVYLILAAARGLAKTTGAAGSISARLYNVTDAAAISGSQVLTAVAYTSTTAQQVAPIITIITITASKTIRLEAKRDASPTWVESKIVSDVDGATTLAYVRLGHA